MPAKNLMRVTEVDRASGSVIKLRPAKSTDPTRVRGIYIKPSTAIYPDDTSRVAAIDAAYAYLSNKAEDKQLDHRDQLKGIFALGVFVGMILMSVIYYAAGV